MIKSLLLVGAGGMIGSMLRYFMWLLVKDHSFPYATLLVNVIGSLAIGAIFAAAFRNELFNSDWRLFLATGVCGGFTTFSAFSMECVTMFQQQRYGAGLLYILVSVVAGILAAFGGFIFTTNLITK